MGLFGRHREREVQRKSWNPEQQTPAIRASICTGERVAGFIQHGSGQFISVRLLQSEADLQLFRDEYGLGDREIKTIY